ncbi:hypothetical protein [Phaffia rhodozyma]|uniref:Uncharacterized protein n=1 Tax=Phaffia rhodozyma TaxID=264483 RepID=A0A0F7SPV9_PHARH|nr:hypothetical protein [Phaffia rhodozyma]
MSEVIYTGSLKSKRKNELQEIARAMGLSVDVSVKISELVAQIQHEMETRREELILHPQFKRLFRPARASASQKNDIKVSSSTLNSGSDTHSHSDSEPHSDDSTVQIEASSGSRSKTATGDNHLGVTEGNDEESNKSKLATNQADASSDVDDSSDSGSDDESEENQEPNAESRPSVLTESLAYVLTSPFKSLPASSPKQKKTPAKTSSSSSPVAGSPRGPSSARKTPSSNQKSQQQPGTPMSTLIPSPIKSAVQSTIQSLTPAPDSPLQKAVSSVFGSPSISKLSNAIPQAAAQIASVATGTPSKLRQQILPVTESPAATAAAEAASAIVDAAGQTFGQVEDALIDAGKVVVEKVSEVDGQAIEGFFNEAARESDLVMNKMNRALKGTHSILSTPTSQTISLLILEAAYLFSNVLTFKTTTFTLPPKSLTSLSTLDPSTPWISLALKVVDWETIKGSKIDVFGPLAVWLVGLVLLPLFLAGLMASSSSTAALSSSASPSEEHASSDVPVHTYNTRQQTKRRSILPHPSQTTDSSSSSDVSSPRPTSNPLIFTILRFGIFLIAQTQLEEFGKDGLFLGQLKQTGLVSTERIGLGVVLSGVGILLGFAQKKI